MSILFYSMPFAGRAVRYRTSHWSRYGHLILEKGLMEGTNPDLLGRVYALDGLYEMAD